MNFNRHEKGKVFWLRLAGSIFALVLLMILLRRQDWSQIGDAISGMDAWRLWALVVLTIFSRLAVTLRWHVLFQMVSKTVRFSQSLKLTFAGLFASNFLPTTIGGDVVRLVGAVQMGIDPAIVTISLIADRLVGMAAMVVTLPWGLARLFTIGLPALFEPQEITSVSCLAGFFTNRLKGFLQKVAEFLKRMAENLSLYLKHPRSLIAAFLFTNLHMLFLFTTIWLVLVGVNEPVSWLRIAGIWSLVYFITLLPISINGYGLQEVSVTLLYARLGGISIGASLVVALLIRSLQMLTSLAGAFFISGIMTAKPDDAHELPEKDHL